MLKAFFKSREWAWWAWGGSLLLLSSIAFQVHLTVLLNEWYGGFYNIMQSPDEYSLDDFYESLGTFFTIAMPYVGIAAASTWFGRMYALAWREAITFKYVPRWVESDGYVEGASQRIQEDTQKFARIVETLGVHALRSVMTLIAFLPLLWGLSSAVEIPYLSDIPGSLVWVACIVSFGGLFISWFVGYALPGLEYNNQVVEAKFRKELVVAEDHEYKSIELLSLFTGIRTNYRKLYNHYGYFDVWSNLFSQSAVLIPYMIMGPSVMTSTITLGIMVQTSNAFGRVQQNFSMIQENWTTITELRSIWKRLHEFERSL